MKPMPRHAMILAAGRGSRLGKITDTVPKCMIPLQGKPLLEHTVLWLKRFGVTELVINVCHLADAITSHFGDGSKLGVHIEYSREEELLGTAGSVRNVGGRFDGPFFVWYGDNISNCRLDRMWAHHAAHAPVVTMALHERPNPVQSGIVGLDGDDRVTRFLEKPKPEQIFSKWVNTGILLMGKGIVERIPAGFCDFSKDVFPAMLASGEHLSGYRYSDDEQLWWFDTPADVETCTADFGRAFPAASGASAEA